MADAVIQLAPDSTGKMVDNSSLVVGANTVHRQRVNLADPTAAAALAAILNAAPAGTEYALVARPIHRFEGSTGAAPPAIAALFGVSDGTNLQALLASVKGTQAARALAVQALKDSGRTLVVLSATAIASVTSEALMTVQKYVGGVVTTGVTEYVVTAGKTLRVLMIRRGVRFTTMSTTVTFANTTIKLRRNTTTLATTSSLVTQDNLAAASNAPVPDSVSAIAGDGMEFAGGDHIGFTHIASATTLSQDILLIGYEY